MFIEYLSGPGLVRLYWLELLSETLRSHRASRQDTPRQGPPAASRRLRQAVVRFAAGLGNRLARRRAKSAGAVCR